MTLKRNAHKYFSLKRKAEMELNARYHRMASEALCRFVIERVKAESVWGDEAFPKVRSVAAWGSDAALWTLLYLWMFQHIEQAGHVFRFAMWLMSACLLLACLLMWCILSLKALDMPCKFECPTQAWKSWRRGYENVKTVIFTGAVVWMGHTVLGAVLALAGFMFYLTVTPLKKDSGNGTPIHPTSEEK